MDTFRNYYKSEPDSNDYFYMYHGGMKWSWNPEIRSGKKGRYEHGLGIYFTNIYNTARSYAKGSKIVIKAKIKKNYKDIKDVEIPFGAIGSFLAANDRLKNKRKVFEDLNRYIMRFKLTKNADGNIMIPADVFNNYLIDNDALTGESGIKYTKFIASHGVQAKLYKRHSEDWLIIFDPSIILGYIKVNPKLPIVWELPRVG